MTAVWDERERGRDTGMAKTVSLRDGICSDRATGPVCTLKEERAQGSYTLRIRATQAEMAVVNEGMRSGLFESYQGVSIKPDRCKHGVTFLTLYRGNYSKNLDAHFIEEVRKIGLKISKLLFIELQR